MIPFNVGLWSTLIVGRSQSCWFCYCRSVQSVHRLLIIIIYSVGRQRFPSLLMSFNCDSLVYDSDVKMQNTALEIVTPSNFSSIPQSRRAAIKCVQMCIAGLASRKHRYFVAYSKNSKLFQSFYLMFYVQSTAKGHIRATAMSCTLTLWMKMVHKMGCFVQLICQLNTFFLGEMAEERWKNLAQLFWKMNR